MEEPGNKILEQLTGIINKPFFELGGFSLTLFSIFYVLALFIGLYFISSRLRAFLIKRLGRSQTYNPNVESVLSLTHYAVLAIGLFIILQSAGLDLSALAVLAGALGIGLGFGLQNITNNFVSGLIILFERPVKVGDRIEVKDVAGQILRIGMRSSTVLTNDNISIIVPNSDLISHPVVNWSHTDDIVRLKIPIGVSYKSDPHKVVSVLQEVLNKAPGLVKGQSSSVVLDGFGDSSLNFIVRVWTQDFAKRPGALRHQINMAIWDALKEADIEIPFPQMDLHVKGREQTASG